MLRVVEHYGTSWRTQIKKKALEYIHLWAVFPPTEPTLTDNQIRSSVIHRVAELLDEDSFCNHGHDYRLETPVNHQGQRLLFNHPSFLKFVNTVIYGESGIATKESVNFLQTNFPISVLCMLAAMVRGVLRDHAGGVDNTKQSKKDKTSYRPHYTYFLNICSKITDSGSAYHISLLADATREIVKSGSRTLLGGDSVPGHSFDQDIPSYLNLNMDGTSG